MTIDTQMNASGGKIDARLTALIRYWDTLRGDRLVPGRLDVQPAEIARHLSRVSILERPRAGTVRMRLSGANLSNRMGHELRGMPFRSLFEANDREHAMIAAETAMATPAITVLALGNASTGALLDGHLAILPLLDTRGQLTRAMAVYSERPATAAFPAIASGRFTVLNTWQIDIPEHGPVLTESGQPKAVSRPVLTSGNRQIAFEAAPLPQASLPVAALAEGRPVFRVIQGGRA
ncbi:PAS domain-containing protein [Gymnodinialimonas sp. 2305UL16-5]|uniref:PAS domain-containing protein n=1 Tax=Gymnodinialimonas mytili TaxID=3126503 RepID=UPI0030B36A57